MTCTTNADPGGAGWAVYAITRGPAELRTALDGSLREVAVRDLPRQYPIPGPVAAKRHPSAGQRHAGLWPAQRRSDHRSDYRSPICSSAEWTPPPAADQR